MDTKKLTALSMLTAVSLIIFIIEAQLPPLAPIPGIKLGLANVITLVTLVLYGRREAFTVLALRIALGSIFAGQLMSLMYSISGGMLCFLVTAMLAGFFRRGSLWVLSVFGAIAHNIGQIAVALSITRTIQIISYLPLLIISAVLTGAFTGIAAEIIIKRFGERKK